MISVEGQDYDITNWDEFTEQLMFKIKVQLDKAIIDQVDNLKLVDTGSYRKGFRFISDKDSITITNVEDYAAYLEYGTFEFGMEFSDDTYPTSPVKKKNMSFKQREGYPRGMNPFATIRRVLYNDKKMAQIINKALK